MELQFLCPVHQEWVQSHPQEALKYIKNTKSEGERLLQQHQWREALPYLGCAFESSELLTRTDSEPNAELLTLFTLSSVSLALCFEQMMIFDVAEQIREQSQKRLQLVVWWYQERPVPAWLLGCLSELATGERKGEFQMSPALSACQQSGYTH